MLLFLYNNNWQERDKMKILRIFLKIILVLIVVNLVVIGGYFIKLNKDNNKNKEKEILVVDKIDSFDYVLDNNKNDYYKSLFNELKDILSEEVINYEEYAKSLSKLFISDLFTLSTKVSSSDVGGKEFIYKDFQKDFLSITKTTLYKSVKSNIYGERVQELPTVTNILIEDFKITQFKYKDIIYDDAYSVKLKIEYDKNLGYQNSCELVLIKNENKLEIVKLS